MRLANIGRGLPQLVRRRMINEDHNGRIQKADADHAARHRENKCKRHRDRAPVVDATNADLENIRDGIGHHKQCVSLGHKVNDTLQHHLTADGAAAVVTEAVRTRLGVFTAVTKEVNNGMFKKWKLIRDQTQSNVPIIRVRAVSFDTAELVSLPVDRLCARATRRVKWGRGTHGQTYVTEFMGSQPAVSSHSVL